MDKQVYLLDGSQTAQLSVDESQYIGHPLWACRYLQEDPAMVQKMHEDYLDAGSDIIATFTYQLSINEIMEVYHVSVEKAIEIIQSSVTIAKAAWDNYKTRTGSKKKPIIGGSIGSYGALLKDGSEYTGEYIKHVNCEKLIEFHRPRVRVLLDAGVDFLCFETLPSKVEAMALLKLLREFPNAKAWISFTCKKGNLTAKGEDFGKCVAEIWKKSHDGQLIAIGCNCLDPDLVRGLLKSAKRRIKGPVPFITYSNSGEVFDGKRWTGQKQNLESFLPEWLSLGVKYVGGCCRTNAADIRKMRQVLDTSFFGEET